MKKFIASILLIAGAIAAPAARAQNTFDDHIHLWEVIQQTGIQTSVNTISCNGGDDGAYYSYAGLLVVCQDSARFNVGKQVEWSENDLDTLRHEAHHIVQDCNNGVLGDGLFNRLFQGKEELYQFISSSGMSLDDIQDWAAAYTKQGLPQEQFLEEMEAVAVAYSVDARTIADKIEKFCTY